MSEILSSILYTTHNPKYHFACAWPISLTGKIERRLKGKIIFEWQFIDLGCQRVIYYSNNRSRNDFIIDKNKIFFNYLTEWGSRQRHRFGNQEASALI